MRNPVMFTIIACLSIAIINSQLSMLDLQQYQKTDFGKSITALVQLNVQGGNVAQLKAVLKDIEVDLMKLQNQLNSDWSATKDTCTDLGVIIETSLNNWSANLVNTQHNLETLKTRQATLKDKLSEDQRSFDQSRSTAKDILRRLTVEYKQYSVRNNDYTEILTALREAQKLLLQLKQTSKSFIQIAMASQENKPIEGPVKNRDFTLLAQKLEIKSKRISRILKESAMMWKPLIDGLIQVAESSGNIDNKTWKEIFSLVRKLINMMISSQNDLRTHHDTAIDNIRRLTQDVEIEIKNLKESMRWKDVRISIMSDRISQLVNLQSVEETLVNSVRNGWNIQRQDCVRSDRASEDERDRRENELFIVRRLQRYVEQKLA